MFTPGTYVKYRSLSGTVSTRVVDIVPDIDRTYYALRVTSRVHPTYPCGMEIYVATDNPWLKEKAA